MIRFSDVTLRYPNGETIFEDVDLTLDAGALYFLTGCSGAGKSSFLRLLYFALKPTSGVVTLFDKDTANLSPVERTGVHRRVGVVFQDFRLIDHLTAYENVALPLRLAGKFPESYEQDVIEILEWVGMGGKLKSYPSFLSGGEKQKLAIARAVVSAPDLILADEPTGSIDPEMSGKIMHLFTELNKMGHTIIIATHDLKRIAGFHYPVLSIREKMIYMEGM